MGAKVEKILVFENEKILKETQWSERKEIVKNLVKAEVETISKNSLMIPKVTGRTNILTRKFQLEESKCGFNRTVKYFKAHSKEQSGTRKLNTDDFTINKYLSDSGAANGLSKLQESYRNIASFTDCIVTYFENIKKYPVTYFDKGPLTAREKPRQIETGRAIDKLIKTTVTTGWNDMTRDQKKGELGREKGDEIWDNMNKILDVQKDINNHDSLTLITQDFQRPWFMLGIARYGDYEMVKFLRQMQNDWSKTWPKNAIKHIIEEKVEELRKKYFRSRDMCFRKMIRDMKTILATEILTLKTLPNKTTLINSAEKTRKEFDEKDVDGTKLIKKVHAIASRIDGSCYDRDRQKTADKIEKSLVESLETYSSFKLSANETVQQFFERRDGFFKIADKAHKRLLELYGEDGRSGNVNALLDQLLKRSPRLCHCPELF